MVGVGERQVIPASDETCKQTTMNEARDKHNEMPRDDSTILESSRGLPRGRGTAR